MRRFILPLLTFLLVMGTALVAGAVDTTIKCQCTCRDAVGTYKRSCYSTSSCDTCCAMGSTSGGTSAKLTGAPQREEVETANGRFTPIPSPGGMSRR